MNPLLRQQQAMAAYGRASETVPPARQIIMLYDGIARKMEEARLACLDHRIEDRWNATQKAAQIMDALHACLDYERGGEVATTLDRWYTLIGMRIQQVNVSNDPDECTEIITLIRQVRNAWNNITSPTPPPDG